MQSYKDLDEWKTGVDIADLTYEITHEFPIEERWALGSRMQQTAISIASQIAVGFSRNCSQEYQQLCCRSLASCCELEAQLILADRRSFVSRGLLTRTLELIEEERMMLMEIIQTLGERHNGSKGERP